jgi:uncharacterized protein (TIGR03083 family)
LSAQRSHDTDPTRWTAGPWPLRKDLMFDELDAYLDEVRDPTLRGLPTRCSPWTVEDVTAHLAETFRRFYEMLRRSRAGDLSPPFAPNELDEENLRAVAAFRGDAGSALEATAHRFAGAVDDPDELIAHQLGPIPVGLQVLFALADLAIHHDDVAAAGGGRYRPPAAVVDALVETWERSPGGFPPGPDRWRGVLIASGR